MEIVDIRLRLDILFIDDHPMTLKAYEMALEGWEKYDLVIHKAGSIKEASILIFEIEKKDKFDIIFFDVEMKKDEQNGVEFAKDVQSYSKHPKIAFITMHDDSYLINRITKEIDPDGIINKNDLKPDDMKLSVERIVEAPPFYSQSILKRIRTIMNNRITIDETDVSILYNLSKGVLPKNLHEFINMTQRGIEKRKEKMKKLFEIDNGSDIGLIDEAKKRGFL